MIVDVNDVQRRNFIRLTAKATQFGKPTFTSWLIEAAGTVPLKRRKDTPDGDADNTEVLERLKEVLEQGDAVCLFPEGFSRYHPTLAPLKTGGELLPFRVFIFSLNIRTTSRKNRL